MLLLLLIIIITILILLLLLLIIKILIIARGAPPGDGPRLLGDRRGGGERLWHVCVYVYIYIYMYVCVYIYIYIHNHLFIYAYSICGYMAGQLDVTITITILMIIVIVIVIRILIILKDMAGQLFFFFFSGAEDARSVSRDQGLEDCATTRRQTVQLPTGWAGTVDSAGRHAGAAGKLRPIRESRIRKPRISESKSLGDFLWT